MLKQVRKGDDVELTQRKQRVLNSIVGAYIKNGEPIGSKVIAEEIGVSSATVRNEMAELINLGFLEQPHTSSGRIPTQSGYRKFIDNYSLADEGKNMLNEKEQAQIDALILPTAYDPEKFLSTIAAVLAGLTKQVAVTTSPGSSMAVIKGIQFVQTSRRTAMLVLLSSAGMIKSKVFHVGFDITNEILRMFFQAFNKNVVGKHVSEITVPFIQTLGASLGELSILAGSALYALLEAAKEASESELYIRGQMNLLFYPEIDHKKARRIVELLEKQDEIDGLLMQKPNRVTTIIGRESGLSELADMSVVITRYCIETQDCGAIAIMGPMRMDYPRVFSLIRYTSGKASEMLTALIREE